jgi:hypothetical protein
VLTRRLAAFYSAAGIRRGRGGGMAIQAPIQTPRSKESKREAFLRLAERRTNSVLERIRVLSNCANPYAYEYGDEDMRKIFDAIERELKVARAKFDQTRKSKFKLT